MADSIVKLRVDTKDYDAKIESARKGLLNMEQACRKVGGTLEVVEKEDLAFVKALGSMETKSNTAKGKISELTKAFTDLSTMYNRLTAEEKASPFGKEMSNSLNQLKGRIQANSKELQTIQGEIGGTGNVLSELSGKLGINIGMMTKFAVAGAAVSTAVKVAKDAFFASEASLDEWNRCVESAESVYNGFLTALNTGDISGYMSRINQIISAAREAYTELDRLGTQKAINNSKVQAQTTENQRMQTMLRTGRYIAPLDGRSTGGMKTGDKLTQEQMKNIAAHLQNGMTTLRKFTQDEISQTTRSIEALYKKEATNLGMTKEQFKAGTADMGTFDKMIEGYNKYKEFEAKHTSTVQGNSVAGGFNTTVRDNAKNPYEQYKAWGVFKDDGETFNKINELINQRASAQNNLLSQYGQAYRGINKADKVSGGGGTGTTTKSTTTKETYTPLEGSIDAMNAKIKDLQTQFNQTADQAVRDNLKKQIEDCNKELDKMKGNVKTVEVQMQQGFSGPTTAAFGAWAQGLQGTMANTDVTSSAYGALQSQLADTTALQNIVGVALENGISTASFDVEGLWDKILNGEDIANADWQGITDAINEQLKGLGIEPIQLNFNTGQLNSANKDAKGLGKNFQNAVQSVQQLSGALGQIKNPALNIAAVVGQAIANIALAYSDAMAKDESTKFNIWAFIAAAAAATISMGVQIAAIKSATSGYADGGVISGNHYTSDAVPIMANAGEIVLNNSQQENLASNLQGGGGYANSRPYTTGEKMYMGINNWGKSHGRGELVFSND